MDDCGDGRHPRRSSEDCWLLKMRPLAAALLLICGSGPALACLFAVSREDVRDGHAEALRLYERKDVPGLIALVKNSNHVVKERAALYLGRLRAKEALAILRKNDAGYARHSTISKGSFAVAIVLIESTARHDAVASLMLMARTGFANEQEARTYCLGKNYLWCFELLSAVEAKRYSHHGDHPRMNAAAEELLRFADDALALELSRIPSYGAQYAALSYECRKMRQRTAISHCIKVLKAQEHESPQKAKAAQRVLIDIGAAARPQVLALLQEMAAGIDKPPPPFTVNHTVVGRCEAILMATEANPRVQPDAAGEGGGDVDGTE